MASHQLTSVVPSSETTSAQIQSILSIVAKGQYGEAEAQLIRLAADHPDCVQAFQLLGVVRLQQGEFERALESLDQAIQLNERDGVLHFNRAGALYSLGRWSESISAYRRAQELGERDATTHRGLGCALAKAGNDEEALESLREASRLEPHCIPTRSAIADIYERRGDFIAAADELKQVLTKEPYNVDVHRRMAELFERAGKQEMAGTAYYNLGVSLQRDRQEAKAAAAFERSLELRPDSSKAKYSLAMLREERMAQAPGEYVAGLFDGYAERFDAHLDSLEYKVPEQLVSKLGEFRGKAGTFDRVLDLGCGTGKCGVLLKSRSSDLRGVDLSAGMLREAEKKNIYDQLHQAEVQDYLEGCGEAFNVIIAADLLIYIGDCSVLIPTCASRLSPGGLFAFSIEETNTNDFELRKTGRYAQSETYIRRLLTQAGLQLVWHEKTVLRYQSRSPVAGQLYIATQPPPQP